MDVALTSETERAAPARLRAAVLWILAPVLAGLVISASWGFIYDDAYISLRYAQMFVDTGELAWNPGERVEGYTNFLFVLILAGLIELGVDPLVAARGTSAAGALAMVAGALAISRQLLPSAADMDARALVPVVILGTVAVPMWVMGSMEAPLVGGFAIWAIWALMPIAAPDGASGGRLLLGALLCFLAYLTRMDAVVPLAALGLALVLFGEGRFLRRLGNGIIVALILAAAVAVHLLWRHSYYGEWLPNTYFAKLGVDLDHRLTSGLEYLMQTLLEAPLLVVALVFGLVALLGVDRARRRWALILLAPVVAQLAYVVWTGGDHLPVGRFIVVIMAPAALVLTIGYAASSTTVQGIIILAVGGLGYWGATEWPRPVHLGADVGALVGQHIARTVPADQVIALNTAGATPFYAKEHRFIDMLGLNDAHIARVTDLPLSTWYQKRPGHAKGDGAYVLERAPDIIIPGYADGLPIEDSPFLGDIQLAASDEFWRCYEERIDRLDYPPHFWIDRYTKGEKITYRYFQRVC